MALPAVPCHPLPPTYCAMHPPAPPLLWHGPTCLPCLLLLNESSVSCHADACRPKQAEAAHELEEGGGQDIIDLCMCDSGEDIH